MSFRFITNHRHGHSRYLRPLSLLLFQYLQGAMSVGRCVPSHGVGNCVRISDALIIITPADDLLHGGSQQDSLVPVSVHERKQCIRWKLTCSNWAVYDPFTSQRGGYASTIPLLTRLFNLFILVLFGYYFVLMQNDRALTPRRYLSCPSRSRYRRQNGKVPKFLVIVFNRLFADDKRSATLGASGTFA